MSTSKLQRQVSQQLSIYLGGYTIRENIRPEWLIANDGARLELDFYIEELNAAIEVQGAQHYTFVERFHGDYAGFQKRIEYDEAKRAICSGRGIRLIEVASENEIIDSISVLISLIPIDKVPEHFTSFGPQPKQKTYKQKHKKQPKITKEQQTGKTKSNLEKELSKPNRNQDRINRLENALKHI